MNGSLHVGGVLLDLDDTLYAERGYFESGVAAVARWLGRDDGTAHAWLERLSRDIEANGRAGFLDRIPNRSDDSADGAEAWRLSLLQIYRTHTPELRAFDDVDGFIDRCKKRRVKLGLVTDGKSCVQWQKLRALHLDVRLDAVVVTDDIDAPKPSTKPFRVAAQLLRVPPSSCVYVADDATKDFAGPHALGMVTIHLARPLAFPLAVRTGTESARYRADSLTGVEALLFGDSP